MTSRQSSDACRTSDALSEAAAEEIVGIARESVAARGRFTIALAGGNTPRRTYELLATRHRDGSTGRRTDIVFGDERFVPPDDARSNYRMAREALLVSRSDPGRASSRVPTDVREPVDCGRARTSERSTGRALDTPRAYDASSARSTSRSSASGPMVIPRRCSPDRPPCRAHALGRRRSTRRPHVSPPSRA